LNPHTLAMRELESITLAGIFQINHGVTVIVILSGRPQASRLLWPDKESGQYPLYA